MAAGRTAAGGGLNPTQYREGIESPDPTINAIGIVVSDMDPAIVVCGTLASRPPDAWMADHAQSDLSNGMHLMLGHQDVPLPLPVG
jgi:hypothetical protein